MKFSAGDLVRAKPGKHISTEGVCFNVEEGKTYFVEAARSHGIDLVNGPDGVMAERFELVEPQAEDAAKADPMARLREAAKAARPVADSVNPKDLLGLTKPPIHFIPPVALLHLGQAMANGGVKYGQMNWRSKQVISSIYYDAAMRHLMAWWDGEDVAPDSSVKHLAHAMACLAILLDAEASEMLKDDRPMKGAASALIAALTITKE
jgi:hypothetical protein